MRITRKQLVQLAYDTMNEYNIKSIRQDFKQKGIFYTQRELAEYIKNLLPKLFIIHHFTIF